MELSKDKAERMSFYAKNIDDFYIGQQVKDLDGAICEIVDKTINTIEVFIKKKTRKGINCKQWFDMNRFNQRFKAQ